MTARSEVGDLDLALAVQRVRDLAPNSPTDEAAALTATILNAGADGSCQVTRWSTVTRLPAALFTSSSLTGTQWQSRATPRLALLAATDHGLAETYEEALANLAAAAAAVEPLDVDRLVASQLIWNAQHRAVTPENDQLLGGSIGPIVGNLRPVSSPSLATDGSAVGESPAGGSVVDEVAGPTGGEAASMASMATQPEATSTPAEAVEPVETYEQLLDQLDALVGLESVKTEVRQQAELLRVARIRGTRGFKNPEITRHLVFTGNPGTGKTTVARLVAKIYRSLGLLEKGHLIELDRTGLVGGYLGQTEAKTAEAVKSALGGVLFVDEAYSLAGDQYGDAAIAVLVKAIEDHRDDLVMIAAGYTDRMADFLDMNPGLASRLRLTICFPDYSDDELVEIFVRISKSSDYTPTDDCLRALREVLGNAVHDETFGNARFVRNCFEAALVRQAWRLRDVPSPTDEQLRELTAADVVASLPN